MNAKQAASIRRAVIRVKRNADGQVVPTPHKDALERRADEIAWERHMTKLGLHS